MKRDSSLLTSISHAIRGIMEVAYSERNFRVHLVFAVMAIGLSAYFNISKTEWLFVMVMIAAVLILEVLNTVVEQLIDLVKPRLHPILHDIKDMMAGAVLIAAIASVVVGAAIFVPHIAPYFTQSGTIDV